jgi:hypothetical protein
MNTPYTRLQFQKLMPFYLSTAWKHTHKVHYCCKLLEHARFDILTAVLTIHVCCDMTPCPPANVSNSCLAQSSKQYKNSEPNTNGYKRPSAKVMSHIFIYPQTVETVLRVQPRYSTAHKFSLPLRDVTMPTLGS